jgi:hypothetical protein
MDMLGIQTSYMAQILVKDAFWEALFRTFSELEFFSIF